MPRYNAFVLFSSSVSYGVPNGTFPQRAIAVRHARRLRRIYASAPGGKTMGIKATWHVKLTHGVADWARVFPGVNGYTGSYGRGSTRHVFPGVNGYTGSYGRGDRTAAGACLPSRHPRVLLVARHRSVPAPPAPRVLPCFAAVAGT